MKCDLTYRTIEENIQFLTELLLNPNREVPRLDYITSCQAFGTVNIYCIVKDENDEDDGEYRVITLEMVECLYQKAKKE